MCSFLGEALMRFLEFAYYCGCASRRRLPALAAPSSSSSSRSGRKRRLSVPRRPMPRPSPSRRTRLVPKRRRQWKPTLVTISEDVDVEEVTTRLIKQSKTIGQASKRPHNDYDSRRGGSSRILTAFHPMPYMF